MNAQELLDKGYWYEGEYAYLSTPEWRKWEKLIECIKKDSDKTVWNLIKLAESCVRPFTAASQRLDEIIEASPKYQDSFANDPLDSAFFERVRDYAQMLRDEDDLTADNEYVIHELILEVGPGEPGRCALYYKLNR
ncbi:MAG: hypothetical protein WC227_03925 [Patescibacteria group bacterium]|jgi:hypothetical protein